jgi:hypothetical protein
MAAQRIVVWRLSLLNNCAFPTCAEAKIRFQVTEFLGGHRTRTKAYCSFSHLLLSIMEDIRLETGTKFSRVYLMAMTAIKKFTTILQKEWEATAPKKPNE